MQQQERGTNWVMVLLIWAAGLGAAAQYGKIAVIFDRLPALYPGVGAAMGWTVSLVGVLGIVFGVVAGLFVSAFGYRRTLVCALALGAVMSALQALHLPFGLFLLTRVVEGISHLGVVVAAPTLMAILASGPARGLALTIWSTFFGVAFAILSWAGLPLVDAYGVLALFGVHAAIMAVLAVILHVALRDVPVPARSRCPDLAALPALHLSIYRSPYKLAPAAGWLFYTCCFVAVLTVLPPFFDESIRPHVMGAMPLVSIAVSMTIGALLLRQMPGVTVVQMGFLIGVASILWLWAIPGHWLACMALAAGFGLVQGASFAAVPQLNDIAAAQSEANGAMAQAGNLGNAIGTPLFVAVIAFGGYGALMLTVALLLLCGAVVHQGLAFKRRRWAADSF
ncbi:MFS transporter [Tritonibacter scottomollicae]|uniref:MFS transporter n=1 Tax=Tritonibacter scottomollicae TaxID=483013 RepID=A0ABZ0HKC5_TRISK|nr:MFS transporter [Tritonibacter scottomollicae]WOI34351.1 MFS transporter [Tritonibacter scottomollicae]